MFLVLESALHLRQLYIQDVSCQREIDDPWIPTVGPQLEEIMLCTAPSIQNLIDVFRHWSPFPCVRTLHLKKIRYKEVPYLSRYIHDLGPALQELYLGCTPAGDCSEIYSASFAMDAQV